MQAGLAVPSAAVQQHLAQRGELGNELSPVLLARAGVARAGHVRRGRPVARREERTRLVTRRGRRVRQAAAAALRADFRWEELRGGQRGEVVGGKDGPAALDKGAVGLLRAVARPSDGAVEVEGAVGRRGGKGLEELSELRGGAQLPWQRGSGARAAEHAAAGVSPAEELRPVDGRAVAAHGRQRRLHHPPAEAAGVGASTPARAVGGVLVVAAPADADARDGRTDQLVNERHGDAPAVGLGRARPQLDEERDARLRVDDRRLGVVVFILVRHGVGVGVGVGVGSI